MARREELATAPARTRVGLPIVPDGSTRHPLLLRLPADPQGRGGACNNGCVECVTRPVEGPDGDWLAEVRGRHVVIRDREATLRRDLPARVRDLRARGAASVALLTNGRMLGYPALARALVDAGVDRFVVKLFGTEAVPHDGHTRAPGSFDEALRGIAAVMALGARAHVTYPLLAAVEPAERAKAKPGCVALARSLTGNDPIEMPEPEVVSHGGEYRYDLIELRGALTHPYWVDSFFPMVHVNTGPVCNIRCTYCNVHGGDDQRLFERSYVEMLVDSAADAVVGNPKLPGVPTIDFIGGEPTLHPELPALIARARSRGFPQVTICTNGVLLLRPGYLDSLLAAGLTGVRFSFHDHRPEVASSLADVGDLGNKYPEVARMLLGRTDVRAHIYRILLAPTMDALPDYVRWLAAHKPPGRRVELVFGMPSMRGRLFENRGLYPPLEGLREKVAAAIDLAGSLGIEALLHHAPGCTHPTEPERVACLHVVTQQVDAMSGRVTGMNFEGDARHGAACGSCAGRDGGCAGLPSAYFDADPAAAEAWLRPITYRPATG